MQTSISEEVAMNKIRTIVASLMLLLGAASMGWADSYTGNITSTSGGGLIATGPWNNGGATLSWAVDNTTNAGYWTYNYSFDISTSKAISHVIIELSPTITRDNFDELVIDISSGSDPDAPKTYTLQSGNPGIPGDIYGVKWDTTADPLDYDFSIITVRAPIWGDFYAKDGKSGGADVIAYNTNFGNDTTTAIGNGNAGGWLLIPDTTGGGGGQETPVPEPGTFVLLGSGLVALGLFGRRKLRK
jgi:hypothetical protein